MPETVDGVEVTIAGAPGRGSAGGAGATFTFRTRSLTPGTVLDVLFGAGTDGTFSALDAAPGGAGGSMEESGTAGGNATMLVQRTDSDMCAQSPRNVIAVAGGGGGSSGRQTRSGLFTDSLDLTPPVRGEDSLVWSSGGPSTVRDACRSGMQAKAGEASGTSWYSHLTGGGGGGGGLNSGVGGSAQTASEWTQGNRKNLYGNLPSLVPATGGGAGTSHLAFHSCGNPCSLPAITPNTGPAFVTLRWKQLRDTQVIIRDADGGVLRGQVQQTIRKPATGDMRTHVELDAGTVAVYLGDRKRAEVRPAASGKFAFDLAQELLPGSPVAVRVEFTPDAPGLHRPSTATTELVPGRSSSRFLFEPMLGADGTHSLVVRLASWADASVDVDLPRIGFASRSSGTDTPQPLGEVTAGRLGPNVWCLRLNVTDQPSQEITASFSGDPWHAPTLSMPYQYNPADFAQKAWSRLSVYDGCPVATLSEMPGRPLAQSTPLAAAQAVEHAPSVQDAASSAGNRTNTDADTEPEVRWAGDWKSVSPGSRVTLAVDVEHGRVPTSEGIVDFMLNGSPIGSATPVNGRATLELPAPTSATYRIDAVYTDSADGTGESSLAWAVAEHRTLTVAPEEFALALTVVGIDAALPGGAVDLRAIGSSLATTTPVTGDVLFFDDGLFLGRAPMESGSAVLEDVSLDQESNLVTALFQGDPDRWKDPGGVSVEGHYALRGTELTLTVASVTPTADSAGAVLVELSSDVTSAPVTGEAALYRGNDLLLELSDAYEAPTRPGIAAAWSVPIAALPTGHFELTARFAGDPGVESATSVSTVVDVRPRRTEVSAVLDGSTLRLSATVDQAGISADAAGARPWGVASVYRGVEMLGRAIVVEGTANVPLPRAERGASLRVEFRPLRIDLGESQTTVRSGTLSRTGFSVSPAGLLSAGFLLAFGGALVAIRRRGTRTRGE
ncbi:Ig-like domain-containing protein [Plantibacter flavus]|uniref:Ig-like domain-containing protein n=1 Tax=Plantibacter flavus TaxID=150123 RepID=UPI001430E3BB|nr:Ig-like domain-containing protein [Plantibacter flavus]